MKLTVISCVAAFGFFWAALVLLRKGQLETAARLESLRLREGEHDD